MPKTHFECVLCGDEKFEALPRWVGDSRICDECAEEDVVPQFLDALDYEYLYPPMWGNVVMDIWTFWDLLDDDFKDAWSRKVQEYKTPVEFRLYCEHRSVIDGNVCGAYLGAKGSGYVCCSQCRHYTCGRCEAGISNAMAHRCQEVVKEDPFEKLNRGRDYQQCPGCKKEIFQAAGCNHMTCIPPCETHFCFFCGQQVAARRSGHWQGNSCPRFGVVGKTMLWDNVGEHSEPESEDDEEDQEDEAAGGGESEDEGAEEQGAEDEEALAPNLADLVDAEHLIRVFDQAAAAEDFEENRNRFTRLPWTPVLRESRAGFFNYISLNLAIVIKVMNVTFDLDDVATILEGFTNRDQRITAMLRLYRSQSGPEFRGATEMRDLEEDLRAYIIYARETTRDLIHIVEQEVAHDVE